MSIKKEILDQLLDKYENSAHFKDEARVNRRIMLDLKPPLYNIESPTQKQAVHMVLEDLSKKKLVKVLWLEKNHIARRVQLNLNNVDQAYKEIKREDKKTALRQVKELCVPQDGDPEWLKGFLHYVTAFVDTRLKVPGIMPAGKKAQQNLLTVLRAIAHLEGEEVLERVFSKRCLRDSKYFENHLRAKTASVLSQFKLGSRTVKELEISALKADIVITIENKASYREYCSQMDEKILVIYLAGFPGPMKRLFLKKLYIYAQKYRQVIRFLHWGDIDLGGFRIFRNLKEVVPTLEPYLMDAETLLMHRDQCQELSKGYGKQLQKLLDDPRYVEFREVVELMLRENIRLEQEGIT